MSLMELGPIAFRGTPGIIAFLQSKRVLARQKQCGCGKMMAMQDRADISDGCRWRYPDCHKACSIWKGSFFEKSKITLQKWLFLMHWWSWQYSVKDAAEEVGVSEPTAIHLSPTQHLLAHLCCQGNQQTLLKPLSQSFHQSLNHVWLQPLSSIASRTTSPRLAPQSLAEHAASHESNSRLHETSLHTCWSWALSGHQTAAGHHHSTWFPKRLQVTGVHVGTTGP